MNHKAPLALLLALVPACASVPPRPGGAACTPTGQSPIRIVDAQVNGSLPALRTEVRPVDGMMQNTGSTIRVDLGPGASLLVGTKRYQAQELHFHWPAEHPVGSTVFPAEIHVVFDSGEDALALGTFVAPTGHNAAWNAIWSRLPPRGAKNIVPLAGVDLRQLLSLPADLDSELVDRYCGSLTTPPYGEGVSWLVRRRPISMSPGQLDTLRTVMDRYSRGPQDLGPLRKLEYRPVP